MTRPRSSQGYGNNMAALCRAWLAVKTQASSSFSENRTKKQSQFFRPASPQHATQSSKVFASFFKKKRFLLVTTDA
jgi:hypothetical protein